MEYKFGICEWSLPVSGTLALRLAAEAGFDGIQLGEAGGRRMGFPLNHPRLQELYKEEAARSGLRLHSLNLGALLAEGTMNYEAGTREGLWARESLRRGFAACSALGVDAVVITADPSGEEAFDHAVSHLHYAAELAEDSGVEIAMESALPLPEILRMMECLDGRVKICMDLLNPLRFRTGDPREQIRCFGRDRISHFHLKDSQRALFQPGQRGCVPLGEGDAGFALSAALIRDMAYSGWMITENYYYLPPMADEDGDFLALAARDLQTMRRTFSPAEI